MDARDIIKEIFPDEKSVNWRGLAKLLPLWKGTGDDINGPLEDRAVLGAVSDELIERGIVCKGEGYAIECPKILTTGAKIFFDKFRFTAESYANELAYELREKNEGEYYAVEYKP